MLKSTELLNKIEQQWAQFIDNAKTFTGKGNKAAATRSRTASKELGKLLKEWRKVSIEESK